MTVMQAPRSLSDEGRAAFDGAVSTLSELGDMPSDYLPAIERFAYASERAALVRQAWQDAGRPMLRSGSGRGVLIRDSRHPPAAARVLGLGMIIRVSGFESLPRYQRSVTSYAREIQG